MKCDLCKHSAVHSKKTLLCESCAEMIQRLLIVRERMEFHEHQMPTAAAA
jgi:hypothetical protein